MALKFLFVKPCHRIRQHFCFPFKAGQVKGFSLVELLAILAIMAMMMALAVPVMNSLKSAGDLTKAVYDIKGILDHAGTYAVSNNTHVWVGFFEEDGSQSAGIPGAGRVVVAVSASKNGLRGYDPTSPPKRLDSTTPLVPVDKLQKFDGLHLVSLNGFSHQGMVASIPSSSGMARPVIISNCYDLGNAACVAYTSFSWPLQGTSHYTFSKVIRFDPQGAAHIQYSGNGDFIPLYIEVGLQGTHGNAIPAAPSDQTKGNQAAIQIDGMTGATRLYRP